MKKIVASCILLLLALGLGGGYSNASAQVSPAPAPVQSRPPGGVSMQMEQYASLAAFEAADAHWEYEGEAGPAHWGDLSPAYATCSAGKEQSPVNIPATAPLNSSGLTINYHPSKLNISNNGHTIKVDYDKGSSIQLNGKTYNLLQFHYHVKSEHTINGQYSVMEWHFVNQSADGNLAVLGVMVTEGAENAAYAPLTSYLPAQQSAPATIPGVTVNAADMLPADTTYFHYAGSLTTPPCTEGVNWQVMSHPVSLSSGQIGAFTAIFPNNYRPVQPLNNRTFTGDTGSVVGMPATGNGGQVWLLTGFALAALVLLVLGLSLSRRQGSRR